MMRWWLLLGVVLSLGLSAQEEKVPGGAGPAEEAVKEDEPTEDSEKEEDAVLEWPTLPEWDPEDLEKVKKGEILPGQDLLREISEDLRLPPAPDPMPEEALPPEPEPGEMVEEDPTVIGTRYLEAYFGRRPAGYLMDPQEMLSRQEYRDREIFLEYHAGDSEVNLYVYLFDAEQQLPEGYTIERVFSDHFARTGPTALVFYYLGRPERSQMLLSEGIRAVVSKEEQDRALRTSIQEAFEKSDAAHQLDNFSVEMSIRLYWFEKAMAGPGMKEADEADILALQEARPPLTLPPSENKILQFLTKSLWAMIILVISAVFGWAGRTVARRRLRYVFPEVDTEPLLGAPHAAGVGAVISFSSSQLPPSQQRDHVPDYLQRM